MKCNRIYFILIILTGFTFFSCQNNDMNTEKTSDPIAELKNNFQDPPSTSGVNCWWWWLNGNVDREAITKDLEAMKARNFHGAMIFDAGGHNQRGNSDLPDGPLYGSEEWNELFVFALDEARRLGLEMGFNIQSGWNLGGPRVSPEHAAKQLTYSQELVSGDQDVMLQLEQPASRFGFYKDIAILAFTRGESGEVREGISGLDLKLGFRELGGSAPDCRFLLENKAGENGPAEEEIHVIRKDEIIDLSGKMDAQGRLSWQAPEGEWVVLRVGYTCTDAHVSTSSNDWQGLVLDYMSKEAFDYYWKDVVDPIFEAAGDHVGSTLKYMETDSWECGGMNWTGRFAEEFAQYRGYELLPYLPVVAGYVVEDTETSNAFLADFRKTLADLVAYKHYAYFQEYAHKYGMGIQPESAGPHAGPLDGIKNYGYSDIVMSEFWSPSPHRPLPENRFYLKQASSAAHIYGKKIVGAESFTTIGPHWNDELWHDQKSAFDHEICAGLNRLYFHTFTCSPPSMGLPGQEYFAGTHVNPQVTWWDYSEPFIDYMHRIQSVLQQGSFVADVLYYYGDHVPNVFPHKHSDPAGVMPGFDYDVTDENILLQLEVDDGSIVVPGGLKYRLLVLPDHKVLSLAVLEKLEKLVKAGATVLGYKPEKMVSLTGGSKGQKAFSDLAGSIWGEGETEKGEQNYGNGNVVWGSTARKYLLKQKVAADFSVPGNDSKTDFDYIHYTLGDSDVYFVSNQTPQKQRIHARFRVSGKQPELWDPLSGNIRPAKAFSQDEGRTTLPLTFEPYASVMVVFSESIPLKKQGSALHNYDDLETAIEITGPWELSFDPEWGGPETVEFPELMDWTLHPDEGIRYYSGEAVYRKNFSWEAGSREQEKYFLQLGSVKDVGIAAVKINGKDKGIVWTPPFRMDISEDLLEGENRLEIMVVNSWYNRVAGDQINPHKKQYTSTNIRLDHDFRGRSINEIPLEPSGLLGPLTIETRAQKYSDGRPEAMLSMAARDQGRILLHGDGPDFCDVLGAREALIFKENDTYHLFYDGAGPKGWVACLATSRDMISWEKHGPILAFGNSGDMDQAAACSPWVIREGDQWHMFYLGTPNASPAPDLVPSFPYLTMKAKSASLAGPWTKQPHITPFSTRPNTWYSVTASPGHVVKKGKEFLQFFSSSTHIPGSEGVLRTLGIARTMDLDGEWTIDPDPMVPVEEQVENSSLYYEESIGTWFLFTNHIGIDEGGGEYTDAVWVYWSRDLNKWDPANKAVVLDGKNCIWSKTCIGMPSVIRVGDRLAIFYDAPGGKRTSHMERDIGLAWLELPLCIPE